MAQVWAGASRRWSRRTWASSRRRVPPPRRRSRCAQASSNEVCVDLSARRAGPSRARARQPGGRRRPPAASFRNGSSRRVNDPTVPVWAGRDRDARRPRGARAGHARISSSTRLHARRLGSSVGYRRRRALPRPPACRRGRPRRRFRRLRAGPRRAGRASVPARARPDTALPRHGPPAGGQKKRAAREALEQALAIFEELGARPLGGEGPGELRRISGRPAASEELTETERRVAELAAQGRSNKEIAAELFMGVSTVEIAPLPRLPQARRPARRACGTPGHCGRDRRGVIAMPAEVIGREEELGAVEAFLADMERGPAALVLSGEAGIGKTILWEAGVEQAAERFGRVLSHRSVQAEASLAFGGLSDLLSPVLEEVLPSLAPPRRRALEVALWLADPGEQPPEAAAIGLAFLDVLRLLAERGPVLVALDDLQWLDSSSALVIPLALAAAARGARRPSDHSACGRRGQGGVRARALLPRRSAQASLDWPTEPQRAASPTQGSARPGAHPIRACADA